MVLKNTWLNKKCFIQASQPDLVQGGNVGKHNKSRNTSVTKMDVVKCVLCLLLNITLEFP